MKKPVFLILVVLGLLPLMQGAEATRPKAAPSLQASGALRAGVVWEVNPLLSSNHTESGPAVFGSLEALAWKGLTPKTSLSAVLSGERRHRVGNLSALHDSEFWFGEVSLSHKTLPVWESKVRARALSQTEVMDFSDTAAYRVILPVTNRAATVALNEQVTTTKGLQLRGDLEATRSRFSGYRGDFREGKGRVSVGWKRRRCEAEAGLEAVRRNYDFRTHYSLSGRPLMGDLLKTTKERWFATARLRPDGQEGWGLRAKSFTQAARDSGTGFFDTRREGASLEITRSRGPWDFKVSGEVEREEYRLQTVGTGIHPPRRRSLLWEGEASLERSLGSRWSVVGEASIQKMDANSDEYRYRTVTVSVGLECRF